MVGRLAHSAASRSETMDSCQIRSYTFSGSCGSYSARFPLDPTFFGPFILITWSLCRLGMAKDRVHMGFQPYGNGKVHVVGPWEWPVGTWRRIQRTLTHLFTPQPHHNLCHSRQPATPPYLCAREHAAVRRQQCLCACVLACPSDDDLDNYAPTLCTDATSPTPVCLVTTSSCLHSPFLLFHLATTTRPRRQPPFLHLVMTTTR